MTQSEIAEHIGVSQMQVSRLIRRSLKRMRDSMDVADEIVLSAEPGPPDRPVNAARVGESAEYDRLVATGEMRSGVSDSGVAVLELEGEHDIYTAPKLRDRLGELVETGPGVVVDLSDATFVDSSILGRAAQRAPASGRRAEGLCGVPRRRQSAPAVRRVFEMTGLSETLPVLAGPGPGDRVGRLRTTSGQ